MLSTQIDNYLCKDFAGGEQILDAQMLICPVHIAVKARHSAAEGDAAWDVMDIGAPADSI